ncbi:hypothetical protein BU14_0103s0051 [Porphyra umbilicalis]|uniref:Uncharacterized protein n=1 Tax=Porphyra umbilicalis TaxID=2786 RepID=A0A1X6PCV7_PORUM|nr:hypothetical protein BU14_0103s0051 [Porphyra umbilicalis]|eukprot:OSX78708.1 hypothetical protein BU14_0103s0051 [Porphyra umbilicalis]
MVPPGGAPASTAQQEADAAAAAERAAAVTAASVMAAAEAAAAEAAARARTAAAEAVAAEAAAAAAKVAAGQSAAPLAAWTAPNMLLPGAKPTHTRAPEWSGPDGFVLYEEDVKVWPHMTTLPDDKKGGAMRLALGGVAKEAAPNVGVDQLVLPTGYRTLLECLRLIFGRSESQRGHDAYRTLKALYRGSQPMEEYLAAIGQALVQCRINGYSMSGKTAAAIVLDQAGLDANQQASTKAAAAVLTLKGSDTLNAVTISLRDLWEGDATLKPSPDAAMMVVTYGEHQAYLARRTTPTPRPKGGAEVYRGSSKAADPAGCWRCGKTGHIRRDCRKRAREAAAEGGSAPPTDGGGAPPGEGAFVAQEVAHVVFVASPAAGEQMRARTGDVILDIGATATLAGAVWVASYMARLPPGSRARITFVEAAAVFTFGDGNSQRAYERVTLPMLVGGATCYIRTWVVAGHLPLLLGRATMASLGVVLDVAAFRMAVTALGVEVPLSPSAAGHLTINALDSRAAAGVPSVPTAVTATARASSVPAMVAAATRPADAGAQAPPSRSSSAAPRVRLQPPPATAGATRLAAASRPGHAAPVPASTRKGKEPASPTTPSRSAAVANGGGPGPRGPVSAAVASCSVADERAACVLGAGSSHNPPVPALRAFVLAAVLTSDTPDLHRKAFKLHTQYGHCSAARLNELLRTAGAQDAKVFEAVTAAVDGCDACKRTAPRPPRPLVAVPRALQLNDTVAVDLAQVAPVGTFLHMVDLGTRFSKAVAITNKEATTVARALLAGWFVHHGAPRALLADPGAEFNNAVWRIVAERHNVAVLSTAGQAHWSNGVVERHNLTLKTMVATMALDHVHVPEQELLDPACHAKNSMGQHHGATPYQLTCGSSPRIPSALADSLPALSVRRVPGDEALHRHLDLLHAARSAHTQAEAAASLRRALARNAANVPVNTLSVGDAVYFWTDGVGTGRCGWQGPAHVTDVAVAKEEVRLQYGHLWVNRAASQVRPVGSLGRSPARPPTPGGAPTPAPPLESAGVPAEDLEEEDGDTESVASSSSSLAERTASIMTGVQSALDRIASEPVSERRVGVPPATAWTGRTRGASRPVHFAAARDTSPGGAAGGAFEPLVTSPQQADEAFAVKRFGFQRGAIRRRFSGASTLDARRRKVEDALMAVFSGPDSLAAALRRTGVHTHQAFVTRREMRRRAEVPIAVAGAAFDGAIMDELAAWADLAVHTEVPFDGQVVLSTRWVLTVKEPDTPTSPPRRKARLVVRGFEDPKRDNVDSTSPTASRATFRVALSAMDAHGFIPRTVDVRTAFLQGMPLDRPTPVYVQPPPQAQVPAGMVWRLRKCAYGLTDAPRRWYDSVLALMVELTLQRSTLDHGLFTAHADGVLQLVVAVHVDDFLFGGTPPATARFETALRRAFDTGPTKSGDFTFTGVRVRTSVDEDTGALSMRADQEQYVDSIECIDIHPMRKATPDARLVPEELTAYRRATGALLWATGQTMPYLACAATTLARRFGSAVVRDLTVANRVVAAAKAARPLPLVFPAVRGPQRLRLFVDASSVKTGIPTAHTGYAVFSTSEDVPAGPMLPDAVLSLLLYVSHRQRRVTHSSFAAEVYALLEGVRAALELAAIHAHIHTGDEFNLPPIDAYTDNLSLYNTLDADGVVQPKEVGAAVQELREFYHGGTLATVTWLRARGQLADALTKAGRDTPLQQTIRTGMFGVRLAVSDYLTNSSPAARGPGQVGIVPASERGGEGRM